MESGVLNAEELGRLETAAAVLDAEVDRLLRLRDAREEVTQFTGRVRDLLADVQTVHDALTAQQLALTMLDQRIPQVEAQLAKEVESRNAQRAQWREDVEAQQQLLAQAQAAAVQAEEAMQARQAVLEADFATVRQRLTQEYAAAAAAHAARMAALADEMREAEARVQQAHLLREQLTALRD